MQKAKNFPRKTHKMRKMRKIEGGVGVRHSKKPEKTLGELVRMARRSQRLSQDALAIRVGACKRTICGIENNKANPKFEIVYQLVRELRVPLEPLFYPERWDSEVKKRVLVELNQCTEEEMKLLLFMIRGYRATQEKMEKVV